VRTFVEVGPKNTLCNLILDTFEEPRCIHTSLPENEAYAFRAAAAQLYALGYVQPAPGGWVTSPEAPAPAPAPRPTPAADVGRWRYAAKSHFVWFARQYLKPALEPSAGKWTCQQARLRTQHQSDRPGAPCPVLRRRKPTPGGPGFPDHRPSQDYVETGSSWTPPATAGRNRAPHGHPSGSGHHSACRWSWTPKPLGIFIN
jgi:hypothetical protein